MSKPIYKRIKLEVPHCPVCKETLRGNNSTILPWNCKCGYWKAMCPFNGEYEIIKREE